MTDDREIASKDLNGAITPCKDLDEAIAGYVAGYSGEGSEDPRTFTSFAWLYGFRKGVSDRRHHNDRLRHNKSIQPRAEIRRRIRRRNSRRLSDSEALDIIRRISAGDHPPTIAEVYKDIVTVNMIYAIRARKVYQDVWDVYDKEKGGNT